MIKVIYEDGHKGYVNEKFILMIEENGEGAILYLLPNHRFRVKESMGAIYELINESVVYR